MSGETEQEPSAWTIDSVHVHVLDLIVEADKRNNERFVALRNELLTISLAAKEAVAAALTAQKEAVAAALMAAEKAVLVAEANSQLWRASANEWRGSMDDRERNFARADAVTASIEGIRESIADVKGRLDRNESGNALASRVTVNETRHNTTDRAMATGIAIALAVVSFIGVLATVVALVTR